MVRRHPRSTRLATLFPYPTLLRAIDGPPVIVVHSMGGFVAIAVASLRPVEVAGTIVCDSPVTEPAPDVTMSSPKHDLGTRPRPWASPDLAVARFRTVPPQTPSLDFVCDHVARRSLKPVDGGWHGRKGDAE